MIVIRCTALLLKAGRLAAVNDPPRPTAPLGEWYATVLQHSGGDGSSVVFVHNATRLAVVTTGSSLRGAIRQFRSRLPELLARLDIPGDRIDRQVASMGEVTYAPTAEGEMLAALTAAGNMVRRITRRGGGAGPDLDMIENELASTPPAVGSPAPEVLVRELLVARTLR